MASSDADSNAPQQVVFIDSNVPDIADLLSGLAPGEVAFVIDPTSDGVQQIANILAANNLTNLASISIVGHGAAGAVDLGSSVLDDGDLSSHASELAEIGAALAPGGDLQLYSCNTASGATGRQFIADLSSYVGGATVAASTRDIGETATGENWTLDAVAGPTANQSGSIAAPAQVSSPFTAKAEAQFSGTLTAGTSEVWIAGSAAADENIILHDDDTGSDTESNQGDLFTPTSGNNPSTANEIDRLDMIRLDTQDQKYFIGSASETSDPTELLEGSLSSVLANPNGTPTYTTLWTDTSASRQSNELTGIAADPASQQVFFVDGTGFYKNSYSGNTGTVTTLDPGNSVFIEGLALDLPDHVAYFIHSFQTNITTTTKNGVVLTSAPSPITANEHVHHIVEQVNSIYETSGGTTGTFSASSTSVSLVKLMDVSSNLGAMANLGTPGFTVYSQPGNPSNPLNGKIFFTTETTGSGGTAKEGGVFELDPSTQAITTLFRQDGVHGPTGTLTSLQIDYATNQYYVTVINSGGTGGTVWVGSLSGGTPTQFDTLTSQPDDPTPFDLAVDAAPTLAITATNPTFTESSLNPASSHNTPVTLLTSATVTDPDNTEMVSAKVSIGGFFAGDTLSFSNNNSITGSYNSSSGVLTFSGEDTFAHYQTALASVQFTSTSDNPTDYGSDTSRTLSWTVNDGLLSSAAQTETVSVVGVNDPPTLSNVATGAHFTEAGGAVVLSNAASVSDPDNLDLANATVSIAGGTFANDGDVLSVNTTGTSITASYNSTSETLTLTGSDTLAHYQSVLNTVSFNSTSLNPDDYGSQTTRQVTWILNDGSGSFNLSTTSTTTVTITAVNNPPTLTGVTASDAFTEKGSSVTLSSSVTASDPDNLGVASATVQIAGGTFANDGDVLSATGTGNITVSYNSTNETLLLTGSDTFANYQSVLDSVTFNNTSLNPTDYGSNLTRTVTWVLNDGSSSNNLSTAQTTTVSITAVNDPPTLNNVATGAHFTEGGGAVVLSNAVSVIDPDNLDLANATVSITTGTFAGDGDVLSATAVGNITVSYDSTSESLILTGSDTLADYQSVLDSVSFNSSSLNPTDYGSVTQHQVVWELNDGSASNNLSFAHTTTVTMTAVNNPPTLTGTANASYTELASAVKLSPSVTVADPDNLALVGATVQLTGGTFANDGDVLAATATGNITVSYNSTNESLILTGSDTLADYQSVLDTVTFADPGNHNPTDFGSDPTRTVTWTLNDGSSSNNLGTATSTVSITAVNDPPTLSNVATSGLVAPPSATVTVSNALSVTDPDNLDLASATVSITGGTFSSDGDVLAATAIGNITVNFNSTTETLLLTGSDTLAHYQSVLDSVTFHSTAADPSNAGADPTRTISWVLNDGSGSNNLSSAQFTTLTLAQGPAIGPAATATWTEEGPSTTLSPSVALSDTNGSSLISATVALTGGIFTNDNDVLTATAVGNIAVSYNSSTETLTLTGSDTLADYQSVLDTVAFSAGENPTNFGSDPTRTVTWTVNDGAASHSSASATSTISVINVNDPPTLNGTATGAHFTQGGGAVVLSGNQTVLDPDDLKLEDATVKITTGTFTGDGDALAFSTAGTSITASYNSSTETLTLTGTDTLAHYQSVLDSVTFNSTSLNPTDYGSVTQHQVVWTLQDPSGTANGGSDTTVRTTTVTLTAVNSPPTLANVATSASFIEEGGAVTLSSSVTVSDPDNLKLAGATVSITAGAFTGDVLAATTTGTSITASYNSTSETLVLSGSDTLAHYQSVLDTITFNAGENPTDYGSDASRTVTWTLNDGSGSNNLSTVNTTALSVTNVNDPPTLSNAGTTASFTEEGAAVTLAPSAAVTDPDSLKLVGGTVQIASGGLAPDVLAASTAGTSITASYNSSTQTLTLSGTDTLAHYQSVLDTVTFSSGENPTNYGSDPTRLITWQLNDGGGTANGGVQLSSLSTTTVSVTNVNDPPTLSNVTASQQFTEGGGFVTLSPAVSVSDPDNLKLVGANIAIVSGTFTGDGDQLAATAVNNITVSYNSSTETLVLTGSDTLANYQSVLDSVMFKSTSLNPTDYGSVTSHLVTWVLNDGSGSFNLSTAQTSTIGLTGVNNPPSLANVATGAHFTQAAGAVVLSSAVSVSDPDNLDLAGATVSITTGKFAGDGDVLSASTAGTSITASYNSTTETLTLSGSDTLADYQSVLDSVTFNSTSLNPTDYGSVASHQVTWVLNDGAASNNLSAAQTTTVSLTAVNVPPTLTGTANASFTEKGAAVTLSQSVTVTDPDDLDLASATVALTGGTFATDGDVLGVNGSTSGTIVNGAHTITISYSASSETLTLTGADTLADYQAALDQVTFNSSSLNPTDYGSNPARTVTWTLNDGGSSHAVGTATSTISVTAVNDPPTLTGTANASFTEKGSAATLSGGASVSDPDSLDLASATVRIIGGTFAGDGDVLGFSTAGTSITASYNSSTETLTLSGSDTLADYKQVLDSVTFSSTSLNPTDYDSMLTRTVAWTVNDGSASNATGTATSTVSVTGVNDPPTLSSVPTVAAFHIAHTLTVAPNLTLTDPDSLKLANATLSIVAGTFTGDGDILAANTAGTSIVANYNSTTETLTLTGSDTVADYQKVLDSVTFTSGVNPGNSNSRLNPTRTLTWLVNDGSTSNNLSSVATTTISIQPTVKNDFNGDEMSDVLFQDIPPPAGGRGRGGGDLNAGAPEIGLYNGSSITSQAILSNPGTSWHIAATGDFNADGNADIVWQNTNGTPMIWTMNGTSITSQITLTDPGSTWSVIATGDFNDDGFSDILWQNSDGTPMIWTMNGTSVASSTSLTDPGSNWKAVGTGDFNGDGKSDIVFQSTDDTQVQIWEMNGTSVTTQATLADPGSSWRLVGTGDFNGDGKSDLLFQNSSQTQVAIWEMNGTSVTAQATLTDPGSTWRAIGTGDFNGDGKSDILFQNTDGTPMIWTMNGTSVTSTASLASPGLNWHSSTG